ncbi:hypothetical protein [Parvularcula sp. IMCC14364]|uniref:hypothetical protein n=1 Tax=Parvularcula sp. IMCC14364 TaxID=3067902 RepID=UPI002740887B|nr:hypothetical protein [Parvularcula sp. IMCC14364]
MIRSLPMLIAACICAVAFLFGIIRIGVGAVLATQAIGIVDVAAFSGPVTEIQQFLNEQNDQALLPLTPVSYLAIIAFMGLCLVFGAVLSWQRKSWGYGLLSIYLLTHASLFVNFQTINPKINILIAGIIMLIILVFANQRRRI